MNSLSWGSVGFLCFYFSSSLENTLIYFCDKPVTTGGSHCWNEFSCKGYIMSAENQHREIRLAMVQQKAAPVSSVMLCLLGSVFQLSRISEPFAGLWWVLCLWDGSFKFPIILWSTLGIGKWAMSECAPSAVLVSWVREWPPTLGVIVGGSAGVYSEPSAHRKSPLNCDIRTRENEISKNWDARQRIPVIHTPSGWVVGSCAALKTIS